METDYTAFDRVDFGAGGVRAGHILALGDTVGAMRHHGFERSGDSFSTYRMGLDGRGPIKSLAIDVATTGKVLRWIDGASYLRARITFVGDNEPDTIARGWVRVS